MQERVKGVPVTERRQVVRVGLHVTPLPSFSHFELISLTSQPWRLLSCHAVSVYTLITCWKRTLLAEAKTLSKWLSTTCQPLSNDSRLSLFFSSYFSSFLPSCNPKRYFGLVTDQIINWLTACLFDQLVGQIIDLWTKWILCYFLPKECIINPLFIRLFLFSSFFISKRPGLLCSRVWIVWWRQNASEWIVCLLKIVSSR